MIDVHCHVLPKIDDGSQSVADSFEIMKEAYNNGFTELITTSHYIADGNYCASVVEREQLIIAFQNLLDSKDIKLKLYDGAEAYITPELPELYADNVIPTLANSRYVLFELPLTQKPLYAENVINNLERMGYLPVIAHPERYDYVKKDVKEALTWKRMGAYLQCNYGSLVGNYGFHAKNTVMKLLKEDAVSFFGTDTHRVNTNYCNIDKAIKVLKSTVGTEKTNELTCDNPKKIIENQYV